MYCRRMVCVNSRRCPHFRPSETPQSLSLREAVDELLRVKTESRLRAAYVRSLRQYLTLFMRGRENMPVSVIQPEDIEGWFASREEAPATRASNVGRLSALFAYCVRRRYVRENPCRFLERVRVDPTPPTILSLNEVVALLQAVPLRLLAWAVLALFAGVRPAELDRLSWDSVGSDFRTVTVDATASKVRRRRITHLHGKASVWLAYAKGRGAPLPVPYSTRRRELRVLRDRLGYPAWPQDILRHTCASYWLADVRDAAKVAFELGNSPTILLRHYRELVTREDANRFWSLDPKDVM